jgi:hypothetical protein
MPRKSVTAQNKYQKKYYHEKGLKDIQTKRARLNYWRKKYMVKFNCSLQDCKDLLEVQLRQDIKQGFSSI